MRGLIKLPENIHYTHLKVNDYDGGSSISWDASDSGEDNAQWWLDRRYGTDKYQEYKWWRFWKKTISLEVWANGTNGQHWDTYKIQEK